MSGNVDVETFYLENPLSFETFNLAQYHKVCICDKQGENNTRN